MLFLKLHIATNFNELRYWKKNVFTSWCLLHNFEIEYLTPKTWNCFWIRNSSCGKVICNGESFFKPSDHTEEFLRPTYMLKLKSVIWGNIFPSAIFSVRTEELNAYWEKRIIFKESHCLYWNFFSSAIKMRT